MSVWALIMAAGSGTRMGLGENKVLLPLGGLPVLVRSVRAFDGLVDGVMVVTHPKDMPTIRSWLPGVSLTAGGATRQQSVLMGLRALDADVDIVLVHDAARPLVDADTIRRCIDSARLYGSGVAGMPVKDTIKRVDADGIVCQTPPRDMLWNAQTPQAFRVQPLRKAIEIMEVRGEAATDDASVMEAIGRTVRMVEGSYRNIKLTTREDIAMAEALLGVGEMRIGHGYDVHRLVEGRKLVLCGVTVPHGKGLLGHSDADVATHALMDALLGAAALGDIGRHFPNNDKQYKGISSLLLLARVMTMLREMGFTVCNVDITIAAQKPKLAPHLPEMVQTLSGVMALDTGYINIKATTTEGLGFEGKEKGISATSVALLRKCPI